MLSMNHSLKTHYANKCLNTTINLEEYTVLVARFAGKQMAPAQHCEGDLSTNTKDVSADIKQKLILHLKPFESIHTIFSLTAEQNSVIITIKVLCIIMADIWFKTHTNLIDIQQSAHLCQAQHTPLITYQSCIKLYFKL